MPHTRTREALHPAVDPWLLAHRKIEEARDTISRLAVANADRKLAFIGEALGQIAERISREV